MMRSASVTGTVNVLCSTTSVFQNSVSVSGPRSGLLFGHIGTSTRSGSFSALTGNKFICPPGTFSSIWGTRGVLSIDSPRLPSDDLTITFSQVRSFVNHP